MAKSRKRTKKDPEKKANKNSEDDNNDHMQKIGNQSKDNDEEKAADKGRVNIVMRMMGMEKSKIRLS